MMRTTYQTIEAIKGCLQYLLVDAQNLKLVHAANLIRLAITDLEELTEGGDTVECNIRLRIH